jgi:hypothetical protein
MVIRGVMGPEKPSMMAGSVGRVWNSDDSSEMVNLNPVAIREYIQHD